MMAQESEGRYLEDFVAGLSFRSGKRAIEADNIKRFAAEFDPQPFHLDQDAAKGSIFGGLVASGWYTAAFSMRLLVESDIKPAGGIIGVGFDELSWPRPVYPGDELHVEGEILSVRPSKSRADKGLIKVRATTLNQTGAAVQIAVGNLLVSRRPSGSVIAVSPCPVP
ncbi:MAG: MaoC family dehydratase [Pseudomonadota bacterium]|nr:MaoC family dehydratase [Pseudomonadota bacterium]